MSRTAKAIIASASKRKRTDDETHRSGTIIRWAERDPSRMQRVAITCHHCGEKKFAWSYVIKKPVWSGLCSDCVRQRGVHNKRDNDERLPSGTIIHWAERDPLNQARCYVTCGKCGKRRLTSPPKGERKKGRTLYCIACARGTRTDDVEHKTGTIIHWGDRDPNDRHKVKVTCYQCKKRSFIWDRHVGSPKWSGLCSGCHDDRRHLRKLNEDEKLEPWGSIIHWGERDSSSERRAMVTCGQCGEKRMTTIKRSPEWSGYCQKHFGAALMETINTVLQREQENKSDASEKATTADEAYVMQLAEAPKLIEASRLRMEQARILARRSSAKDWRAVVRAAFPDIVPQVIEMLDGSKPSECALEQIARRNFNFSGRTLKRRLAEQRSPLR